MISKAKNEFENRQEAMELFIKALAASPELMRRGLAGASAAKDLIDGADTLMAYILEGTKP